MLSQKKIDEIVGKHASLFESLEEFEKNGRTVIKLRMNFTIDRATAKKFKDYCKKNSYNMSSIVEGSMKKMLNKINQ